MKLELDVDLSGDLEDFLVNTSEPVLSYFSSMNHDNYDPKSTDACNIYGVISNIYKNEIGANDLPLLGADFFEKLFVTFTMETTQELVYRLYPESREKLTFNPGENRRKLYKNTHTHIGDGGIMFLLDDLGLLSDENL